MKHWDVLHILLQGNAQGPTGGMPGNWLPGGSGGITGNPDSVPVDVILPCDNEGCSTPDLVAYPNFLGTNRSVNCCCYGPNLDTTPLSVQIYRRYETPAFSSEEIAQGDGLRTADLYGTESYSSGATFDYYDTATLTDCVRVSVPANFNPSAYVGMNVVGSFARTCNSASWNFVATSIPPSSPLTVTVAVSATWNHNNGPCS